ncbi:fibronectin type III domain-containing protein [Myxococcota bacterium]|nr:fibronectin type III domain-containing protein [Myxococcota bacterium]
MFSPSTSIRTLIMALAALWAVSACDDGKKKTTATAPAAPTELTATATSPTEVRLAWTDNSDDETGFIVERSLDGVTFAELTTPGADATSVNDTGVAPETTYFYRVRATNADGDSDWSNVAEVTTPAVVVPSAPTDLTATAISAYTIELAWTDNADDETGYEVEISSDGVTFTNVETLAADAVAWNAGSLTPETLYYFRVRATGAEGDSDWSNVASDTTLASLAPPAAPTDLTATVDGTAQITLNWTDNADNETGFRVERAEDGVNFTEIGTTAAGVTSYDDTPVAAMVEYSYRVRATNDDGDSDFSNVATAMITFLNFPNFQAATLVIGQPDFVSNLLNQGGETPEAYAVSGLYGNPLVHNGVLYLPDYGNARVLGFSAIPTSNGASADFVLGQADMITNDTSADATGMNGPQTLEAYNGQLFSLDYGDNRILVWNTPPTATQAPADFVIGQSAFGSSTGDCSAINLSGPEGFTVAGGKLIVADAGNNRVLIWNTIPTVSDTPADLVLGQNAFDTCEINDEDQVGSEGANPTARTLNYPTDVWTDGTRLVVVDYDNNRVLIWSTFPTANFQPADVVLGQADFFNSAANDDDQDGTSDTTASAKTLSSPYFVDSNGTQLFLTDSNNHRVLIWNTFPTADFQPADVVLGQSDFANDAANDVDQDGASDDAPNEQTFNYPNGIYLYGSFLFVADHTNYRYLVFEAQ